MEQHLNGPVLILKVTLHMCRILKDNSFQKIIIGLKVLALAESYSDISKDFFLSTTETCSPTTSVGQQWISNKAINVHMLFSSNSRSKTGRLTLRSISEFISWRLQDCHYSSLITNLDNSNHGNSSNLYIRQSEGALRWTSKCQRIHTHTSATHK